MTFAPKALQAVITLADATFDGGSNNSLTLDGLRMSAQITKGASPTMDWCDIRIWGMTPSQMASASRLGVPLSVTKKNTIQILAGDAGTTLGVVFAGTIQTASQDFKDAPMTALNIGASGGMLAAMKPVQPISVAGPTSAAQLMSIVAGSWTGDDGKGSPLTLENSGVNVTLTDGYFPGTANDQMQAIARAANCYAKVDADTSTLAIWPKTGAREGDAVEISAATGMVGWPAFADFGLAVRALWFPGVKVGGLISLQTKAPGFEKANGQWRVASMTYSLESQMPNGQWFQDIVAGRLSDMPS